MSTVIAKNVQIGTSGTATDNFTIFQPATPDGTLRIGNGNTGITTSQVALTSAGNVGIGTSSPTSYSSKFIEVSNATSAGLKLTAGTSGLSLGADFSYIASDKSLRITTYESTGFIRFNTQDTERARIDSSGNLLVGVTSGSGKIRMKQSADAHSNAFTLENFGNTNAWSFLIGSDNNLYFGYNATSRGVFNNSTGAYTTISDQRLKKDISEIQYGLNSVLALRPVSYLMKDQTEGASKTLGFIAQEVNQIVPESVLQMQDDFYGMDKEALIPVLVKAIQEQQTLINSLKARLDAANL